jgi:maleylacetoacetate isomerase
MERFRLYHYWRSTSSWRVRWGLFLKGVTPEYSHVSLLDGESEAPTHRSRNPFGYVPVLERMDAKDAKSKFLVESIAILEYLEETIPANPLLPNDPLERAYVRALVEAVNAGTQPLQNLSTQLYAFPEGTSDADAKRKEWAAHFIRNGMSAFEALVKPRAGKFSLGDSITLADLCLLPQCYAAERNGVAVSDYPTIARIAENARATEGYRASEPDRFKP